MLYAEVDGRGPRLVLVHGFTQTRRSWGPVAADLARRPRGGRVDAPGHGRSAALAADMAEGAELLGEAGGRATYVGYSMGARLCLHLALARPRPVTALVLVGGTAGIEDAAEAEPGGADDEALAVELETVGVAEFVRRWLAQPLFAGLDGAAAGVDARLENTVAGLAASLRLAGTGAQEPLWTRLSELAMPVLAVAGERDDAFRARAEAMAAAIGGNAEVAVVPGAGHAAHSEAPAAFLAILRRFLARTDAGGGGPTRPVGSPAGRSPGPQPGRQRRRRRRAGVARSGPEPPPDRGPTAPPSTRRSGGTASGVATSASRAHGVAATASPTAQATGRRPPGRRRAAGCGRSPRRTASVRLPAASSPDRSRRLFTTSRAVASRPTGTEAPRARADRWPSST